MTLITVVALFVNKNMVETRKNTKTPQIVKLSSLLILFRGKKIMGACTRAKRYQLKTKTWFGLQKNNKTVCFLPTLGSQKFFFQAKVGVLLFRTA